MGMTDWLLRPLGWLFARRPDWRDAFGRALLRLGVRYYWILALAFALAGAWDQFGHPFNGEVSRTSFDWLMRHRPVPYEADADIVVLDVDEASLADLSPRYGRWPWPRQILAEVAARLEAGGAQAVVFDIVFADPDVANPGSEAAFDRYVASSRKSFYPVVRLNPANDGQSRIPVSMLNFAVRDRASTDNGSRTVAILPPYFKSIYDSTRAGTNNVYPDDDNVVRWYPNFEPLGGYRIPSLPYRMAQALGWPLPWQSRSLLNWPRGTAPYHTIGFAAAYRAADAGDTGYFQQFDGKIVLIGSTAPSLNDIKASPVDHMHPGIYVLATAIDNTRNEGFLRPLSPAWIWIMEISMLAAAANLFARTEQALTVAKYFFILPSVLLGISLASVSMSHILVDLSVPAAILLGYFTFAKVFDTHSRSFMAGTAPFAQTPDGTGQLQVAVLPASLSRDQVLNRLLEPGPPIKLWEPGDAGLGRHWLSQGWVLWRWASPAAAPSDQASDEANPAGRTSDPDLAWTDVPMSETQPGSFTLAQSIATAATKKLQGET
jgi:CHASE2 domain-containing sensor protein